MTPLKISSAWESTWRRGMILCSRLLLIQVPETRQLLYPNVACNILCWQCPTFFLSYKRYGQVIWFTFVTSGVSEWRGCAWVTWRAGNRHWTGEMIWVCRKQAEDIDDSQSSYGEFRKLVPCPVCRGRGYILDSPKVLTISTLPHCLQSYTGCCILSVTRRRLD
jgi:hypothetical protein